jgi:hypothetical protein
VSLILSRNHQPTAGVGLESTSVATSFLSRPLDVARRAAGLRNRALRVASEANTTFCAPSRICVDIPPSCVKVEICKASQDISGMGCAVGNMLKVTRPSKLDGRVGWMPTVPVSGPSFVLPRKIFPTSETIETSVFGSSPTCYRNVRTKLCCEGTCIPQRAA